MPNSIEELPVRFEQSFEASMGALKEGDLDAFLQHCETSLELFEAIHEESAT